MITVVGGRSTRRVHSAGAYPVSELAFLRTTGRPSPACRFTVSLRSTPDRQRRLNRQSRSVCSDEPLPIPCVGRSIPNLPRFHTKVRLPTRSKHSSATQPTQVTPFCHFPRSGQMVLGETARILTSPMPETPIGRAAGGGNFRPRRFSGPLHCGYHRAR